MWTVDLNNCLNCGKRDTCPDRRAFRELLNLVAKVNAGQPEDETSCGMGSIVVVCRNRQ